LWPDHARDKGGGLLQSGAGIGSFLTSGVWLLIGGLGPNAWRFVYLVGVLPAASCSEDLGPPMLETPLRPPALCWLPCYGSDRETGSNLRDNASEQAAGQPAAKPRDGPRHRRR
jgi:hypothetical protein